VLPFPLIYDDAYDLHFGLHVFPTAKYRMIRRYLLERAVAEPCDFRSPICASRDELLLVHGEEWIRKLETGTLTYHDVLKLEVPYSRRAVNAFFLAAGGTVLAARLALEYGVGVNVGGGFHHGFANHGEGFCAVNDIAVAVRVLQRERQVRRVLVVDCDVHQGNGTAAIFRGDPDVFTLSIHQANNYPWVKPPSTLDIELEDGSGDAEYLERLGSAYHNILASWHPQLVIFVAGSDPYQEDQLGGLCLTKTGLRLRDRTVLEGALNRDIPVCVVMAGGYARSLQDTVELHANTVLAAVEAYR
jgi:acetoin utilization deacetylase AcuC-like enzyme